MAIDQKNTWNRFRRLKFDTASLSKRAKRAETLTTKHAHKFVLARIASIRSARRHIINWLSLVTVLIAAVVIQQMWYRTSYTTIAPIEGGTYAEGMLGPVKTLNPLYAGSSAEESAARLLFSGLLDYDQTGHLRNDVAKSLSVDSSGKVYTVKIRDDVYWHDNQKLTADDIVYTVNTMKDPATRATMQSSWRNIGVASQGIDTVTFTLPAPYASFEHALTFAILPKHILESIEPGLLRESQFSLSPVGSGPFSLKVFQTASTIQSTKKVVHLSAWDKYYRGAPKLSRFQIHAYEDSSDIIKGMKAREVNAAIDIGDQVRGIPTGFQTQTRPISSGVYAEFNNDSPMLSDVAVRRALQVGTDTVQLRKKLTPRVEGLDTPVLQSQVSGAELPVKPAFDAASAASLLDGAGWKLDPTTGIRSKNNMPLELRMVSIKTNQYDQVAQSLITQWKSLGVKVQYVAFDPKTSRQSFLQTVLQPRAYDVLINELAIGADPDVFAYWHSSQANPSGLNFANYRNGVADDALLSARLRSEDNLRDQKYKAFAAQWLSDAPAIGLYQSNIVIAHTPTARSIEKNAIIPSVIDRYSSVLYWTADEGQVYKSP